MKTIFLFTSQTSATTSMTRVINTILDGKYKYIRYYDEVLKSLSSSEAEKVIPPKENHFLFHNMPPKFNVNLNLSDYKFIINYRDPRDRLCNEYFWQFSHPSDETEEVAEARKKKIRDIGIDNWVLDRLRTQGTAEYYANLFRVLEQAPNSLAATYAQLCCNFDKLINQISDFTGAPLTQKVMSALEGDRPEKIESHPKWIGGRWSGSDTMPGRYKRELLPSTITKMNQYFDPLLRKMAKHDPEFAHQYLDGLDLPVSGGGRTGVTGPEDLEIRVGDVCFRTHLSIDDAQVARLIKLARDTVR